MSLRLNLILMSEDWKSVWGFAHFQSRAIRSISSTWKFCALQLQMHLSEICECGSGWIVYRYLSWTFPHSTVQYNGSSLLRTPGWRIRVSVCFILFRFTASNDINTTGKAIKESIMFFALLQIFCSSFEIFDKDFLIFLSRTFFKSTMKRGFFGFVFIWMPP